MKGMLLRLVILAMVFLAPSPPAYADASALGRILQGIVRAGAKVDDVPVAAIERRVARASEGALLPDSAAVMRALSHADPAVAREVERLAPAETDLALRMFKGAEVIEKAHPDRIVRAQMLREGGGDLILAAERHGDEIGQSAARIMTAEEVGQLPTDSLARFSASASEERGEQFLKAWNGYIVPHWKPLAAGGAISAFLVEPDLFIDAAGNLTRHATESFARLGVEVAGSATAGAVKGASEGVMEQIRGAQGLWFKIGFGILAVVLFGWIMRRIARLGGLVAAVRRWLHGTPRPVVGNQQAEKRNRFAARSRKPSPGKTR